MVEQDWTNNLSWIKLEVDLILPNLNLELKVSYKKSKIVKYTNATAD